jgi:predicted Holliday junction resolvase-like endonuclease
MTERDEARRIIAILENGSYYADCPCCGKPVLLRDANLFYDGDLSPEAEKLRDNLWLAIENKKEELHRQKKSIVSSSESGARATNIGFLSERIAPSLKDFPFNRNDCRSLFDPIDYLVFEGLSETGRVNKIFFVEIKTGGARLQSNQKEIKSLVESKKVEFKTYKNGTDQ